MSESNIEHYAEQTGSIICIDYDADELEHLRRAAADPDFRSAVPDPDFYLLALAGRGGSY